MTAQFNPLSKEIYSVLERQEIMVSRVLEQVPKLNPFLYGTDSYKVSHIKFETTGVTEIYSNFTARFSKYLKRLLGDHYDDTYVVFGVQWLLLRLHAMAKKGFFDRPKEEVINEMRLVLGTYIGQDDFVHFEKLHDLGYLPIVVKTLDEGSIVPVGLPFLTVRNTLPQFEWLPNYLETLFSTDLWKQLTVATIARAFRLISNRYALETTGSIAGTEWQNHDFGCRGQSGLESSAINGVAFLLSSCGTDNISALWAGYNFYDTHVGGDQLLAGSVSAGEHSVTTLGILTEQERAEQNGEVIDLVEAEYRYKHWLLTERFKTGIVSDVADSFDYWSHVTVNVPRLKDVIMARDGKYVVRGDSGNPVHIIAGYRIQEFTTDYAGNEYASWEDVELAVGQDGDQPEVVKFGNEYKLLDWSDCSEDEIIFKWKDITSYEAHGTIVCLWDIFGGTQTEQGFNVLDSHIGMIYGDGITVQRSEEILERLKEKGFASTNIVFGVGSYSLNMLSRDHLGMAIKATNAIVEINGVNVDKAIYKEPKTDLSKKSARGLLSVHKNYDTGEYKLLDMCSRKGETVGELNVAYMNGQFHKLTNIFEIRNRLWG